MKSSLLKLIWVVIPGVLIIVIAGWEAGPINGAASFPIFSTGTNRGAPLPVCEPVKERGLNGGSAAPISARLRLVEGRGLMVKVWVNDGGPYSFAVDTGAGATILSGRVARDARVTLRGNRVSNIGGLTGSMFVSTQDALPRTISIGYKEGRVPSQGQVVVTEKLPADLDGVLDPTEVLWPMGYEIDVPNLQLNVFDPRTSPIRRRNIPGGAVLQWARDPHGRRPFIRLDGEEALALIDTGSAFGLAVSEQRARAMGMDVTSGRVNDKLTDVGGGSISSRRINPFTVQVGGLELRSVPTDVLYGVEAGSPVILGRAALRPFRVSFDPINRLIEIVPS